MSLQVRVTFERNRASTHKGMGGNVIREGEEDEAMQGACVVDAVVPTRTL